MRTINQEHIIKLIELINKGPFFKLLSMQVRELSLGYCKLEVDLDTKHLNPFGGLHGGVYASLIDTATYWAIYCDLDEDVGLVTIDLKVDNLSPIKDGTLIVEGKAIKVGRTICLSEATVRTVEGKLLSYGTSKTMKTVGLQSINQAVQNMGYDSLPPKFIETKE